MTTALGADAFGETGGDGEHDAIAERDDGLFHRFLGVVAVRDRAAGAEEVGFEQAVHEIQVDRVMGDAMTVRVEFGEGDFAVRCVSSRSRTTRQAATSCDAERLVKHRDGIHTAAEEHADFHGDQADGSG
jgi:hypothetical protein